MHCGAALRLKLAQCEPPPQMAAVVEHKEDESELFIPPVHMVHTKTKTKGVLKRKDGSWHYLAQ